MTLASFERGTEHSSWNHSMEDSVLPFLSLLLIQLNDLSFEAIDIDQALPVLHTNEWMPFVVHIKPPQLDEAVHLETLRKTRRFL